jgi:hypothetical protein
MRCLECGTEIAERAQICEEEVDAFLNEAESRLAAHVSARRDGPAVAPESAAAGHGI